MGDLIFVLPSLIIFFFIIFQIFSLFKKVFGFISKNFDLTIENADQETKKSSTQVEQDYDQDQVKTRIAEAEKQSLAENKEKIMRKSKTDLKQNNSHKKSSQTGAKEQMQMHKKKRFKKKNSSLGEIFARYNEVEKAVIYNEILSKPKALKRD
ncbi:hypothetical protein [Halanaerobium kushneri]|uniref:Uncharacterized protein n=1 Tax=Halanaerobium kushneri TaxID=56779 RepID=A0A1N6V478_9FIRM|nr:hypothetical protein [Halanaerobium kushneri]SIQ72608.1 hypothetical protein SAMN05421834_107103 [Halanaerobium kushneri]